MKLVAISGSLRQNSWNTALLRNAIELMPSGSSLEILSIADVPLFNEDVEAEGEPDVVESLKSSIAAADALVIATPEYNGGIPGVAKNAIDWISRPMSDQPRVLHAKPVALLGATPSGLGTAYAQTAWMAVFRALRMPLWAGEGQYMISRAFEHFDSEGQLVSDELRDGLKAYLHGFIDWIHNSQKENNK
jgi:chromate reductase